MIVEKLTEVYETCISSLLNSQAQRRNMSLTRISPANFTKKARLHDVPELVLQEIAALNCLDVQLYKYARDIFAKQHSRMLQKLVGSDHIDTHFNDLIYHHDDLQERQESKLRYSFDTASWKVILLTTIVFLLFSVYLVVKARRRTSKLKI